MKKISTIVAALLAVGSASAFANSYSDIDVWGPTGKSITSVTPYSDVFNIVTANALDVGVIVPTPAEFVGKPTGPYTDVGGFNKLKEQVVDADVTFWLKGANTTSRSYTIKLDSTVFQAGSFGKFKFAADGLTATLITTLNSSGQLGYTVLADPGSTFQLRGALLNATTVPIPDGGSSLALLGMGVVGLMGMARRKTV